MSERRVYHVKLVVGESVKDGLMLLGGEEQVAGNSDYERRRVYRLAIGNVMAIHRVHHAQVTIRIEALAQFLSLIALVALYAVPKHALAIEALSLARFRDGRFCVCLREVVGCPAAITQQRDGARHSHAVLPRLCVAFA